MPPPASARPLLMVSPLRASSLVPFTQLKMP
jgi:hypothetical protein